MALRELNNKIYEIREHMKNQSEAVAKRTQKMVLAPLEKRRDFLAMKRRNIANGL